jgi:phosphohistidine phosphatase
MKTLLLMNHAKSSWKNRKLKDRDRPLSKRGRKSASEMGQLIYSKELVPQQILSSSVERARETAQLVMEACKYDGEFIFLDKLFMAEADVILDALKLLPDNLERILIVGHNPGIESLLQILSRRVESLPSASIAYISLPVASWKDLSVKSSGELIELWRPKETKKID